MSPAAAYSAVENDAQGGSVFVCRIAPCFLPLPVLLQNSEAFMLLLWQSVVQTTSKDPKEVFHSLEKATFKFHFID